MIESDVLDRVFHALSDPTRRELLAKLSDSAYTISELAEPYSMTLAAVSKHVRVLEKAGLIKREIDGRVHNCSAELAPLQKATAFMEKYKKHWERQFDIMDAYLKNLKKR